MITIHTDTGQLNIPEKLSELTISQVYDFYIEEEKLLDSDNEISYLFSALACCYGEEVARLSIGTINDRFVFGEEITGFGLYRYTLELINNYKPQITKNYSVLHKGEIYTISGNDQKLIQLDMGFTVGEVITIKTFLDYASKRKSKGLENVDFNLSLEQIATILRKQGEVLPVNIAERTKFIDQRKHLFSDLPYTNALDIIFFLLNTQSE